MKVAAAVLLGACALLAAPTVARRTAVAPALIPADTPKPVGPGPEYRPQPRARGADIRGLTCVDVPHAGFTMHLEVFAHGHVVVVPAGLGVTPPRRLKGPDVVGGHCRYPIYSLEPTGLIHVARRGLTLGDLFAVWGQPLSTTRLASFRSTRPVRVYVDGRRFRGSPGAVPLRPGARVVVELGRYAGPGSYREG
jgi:hypothetical protein